MLAEEFQELLLEWRRRKAERPIDFYVPLPHQAKFHCSKKRRRALIAANRSGKTECGVVEDIRCSLGENPHRPELRAPNFGWVVSLTNELQRDVLQEKFAKLLPRGMIKHISYRRNRVWDQIELTNGSLIGFKSCEMGAKVMQGAALHWAHFDEEPEYEIYAEIKMRLTDYAGPSWLTMTPLNGMTWVYDDFVDPKTKGADTEVFGASMWDNAVSVGGHIPDAEIEQVEQSIKDPIERRIRIYGEFLSQVGRIYKLWNEDVHVLAELPANLVLPGGQIRPEFDTYCAIDTGRCFAAGFYVADYLGNVYKFDEHYDESEDERGTIAYRGRTVLNICARYEIWPTFIVDKSTQFYTDLAELGINCQLSDTTDVLRGIDVVRDYLAYDEKKPLGPLQCNPRFYVLDRCEETRREYPRYQWDTPSRSGPTEGEKKNKPKKKNDHALDCDRMMLELRPDASKPPTADEDSRPLPEKIRERVREKVSGRYQEKVRQASDPWGIDDY